MRGAKFDSEKNNIPTDCLNHYLVVFYDQISQLKYSVIMNAGMQDIAQLLMSPYS